MNRLRRDIRRGWIGMIVTFACAIGGALCKVVQIISGLEEREFYKEHPVGWWIAVMMGSGFIISLAYSVRKNLDIHPNIQLRSKPDEVLKDVLADPEYELWYSEALRLLNERMNAQSKDNRSETKGP